jgi:hypothetical protein
MREYNQKNTSAYLFSELEKNSGNNQNIREKKVLHKLFTGDIVAEQDVNEMKNDLAQSVFGFNEKIGEYIEKKLITSSMVIAPLTKQFKDELKKAHARFYKQALNNNEDTKNIEPRGIRLLK